MYEIVRRALSAPPELFAELRRRKLFFPDELAELAAESRDIAAAKSIGSAQFCTLLIHGDSQLAASTVLRGLLNSEELKLADRLVKFKPPSGKRDELGRIIERAIYRRKNGDRL